MHAILNLCIYIPLCECLYHLCVPAFVCVFVCVYCVLVCGSVYVCVSPELFWIEHSTGLPIPSSLYAKYTTELVYPSCRCALGFPWVNLQIAVSPAKVRRTHDILRSACLNCSPTPDCVSFGPKKNMLFDSVVLRLHAFFGMCARSRVPLSLYVCACIFACVLCCYFGSLPARARFRHELRL